jgi:hypothetical protein
VSFGPYPDLAALAQALAADLCNGAEPPVTGSAAIVAQVLERGIRENFHTEEQILQAADQALRELGPSSAGMDKGKLLAGLRERIAKQRGFTL